MKKLILLELAFLFLATTFQSDNPPGWYQQTLPVNDFINDIFFLDSLNGWVVTKNNGYILNTTNGGNDWDVQLDSAGDLQSVKFLDNLNGYVLGNGLYGIIYKTTNGGINWNLIHDFNPAALFKDMSFINKDTGWICSIDNFDGGVFKTIDGGISWHQQLNYTTDNPKAIFFTSNDTGWIGNENRKLYKTTDGGSSWNLQTIFPSISSSVKDILFFNSNTGFVSAARIYKTTNGGITWDTANDGGIKLSFANDSIGWAGDNFIDIKKTTNGGSIWFNQFTNTNNPTTFGISALNSWAGGNKLIRTTDGGGLSAINQLYGQKPVNFILYQNYPNPFNPISNIKFELKEDSYVNLKIFDASGKGVQELIKEEKNAGEYKFIFNGSKLSSGVYFYRLETTDNRSNSVFSESKKMLLLK